MKNSFYSDNFICLINAIPQALTVSNDLTQSEKTGEPAEYSFFCVRYSISFCFLTAALSFGPATAAIMIFVASPGR